VRVNGHRIGGLAEMDQLRVRLISGREVLVMGKQRASSFTVAGLRTLLGGKLKVKASQLDLTVGGRRLEDDVCGISAKLGTLWPRAVPFEIQVVIFQGLKSIPVANPAPHLHVIKCLKSSFDSDAYLCVDIIEETEVVVTKENIFARESAHGLSVLHEIKLLATMQHENVMKVLDVLPVPHPEFDDISIVMPHMRLDLHRVVYSKTALSKKQVGNPLPNMSWFELLALC